MSREWLNSRWFALLVLISTAASGFLWYFDQTPVLLPLIIGGLPLLLLYLGNRNISISIPYTVLLVVFLLTAAVGVWASYNQEAAIQKFWILLGSILIFYAIAAQPPANINSIFWGLSFLGLAIAGYYLLTYQPFENPADLVIIDRVRLAWVSVRPDLSWPAPNSNFIGGILAVLSLCTIAMALAAWRAQQATQVLLAALILAVQIGALWLSSSRAAWASLGVGLAVCLWWELSKTISLHRKISRSLIFRWGLLIAGSFAIILVIIFPSQIFTLAHALPGAASADTRAGLFSNALELVPDFWLTGGGLQSFAGLYSHYILGIPDVYLEYGHNLYLDIPIEQGVFGLGALLAIYGIAGVSLLNGFKQLRKGSFTIRRFYPAVFAGLIVLLMNAAFDDPLYGERGTPLLFVIPGLAFLMTNSLPHVHRLSQPAHMDKRKPSRRGFMVPAVIVGVIGVLLVSFFPMAAAVEANLGAVHMARIELANFPSGTYQDGREVELLAPAQDHFQQALLYNPGNRTANYRTGLFAMLVRDYPTAIYYLETAHSIDASHQGVTKALGYSYVWNGEFDRALTLMANYPEAQSEMECYTSWWHDQKRPDLAEHAAQMVALLSEAQDP